MKKENIVIKIGGALNTKNGVANKPFIESVCSQISKLTSSFNIIVVISGAIPIGKSNSQESLKIITPEDKAIYSMMGQNDLVNEYITIFRKYNIKSGQGLYTGKTLQNSFTKNVFKKAFEKNIIILANENDSVNPEELDGDNDLLASKISRIIKAKQLIIMSSVDDGVEYRQKNNDGHSSILIIRSISAHDITDSFLKTIDNHTTSRKDSNGIKIKLRSAKIACENGVGKVFIINGKTKNGLIKILIDKQQTGTIVLK